MKEETATNKAFERLTPKQKLYIYGAACYLRDLTAKKDNYKPTRPNHTERAMANEKGK